MPPLFMTVRIAPSGGRRGFRLWVPVFLIWILLLPFVLVLLPVYFVTCAVLDIHPFRALGAFLRVLGSLGGTHVEVQSPGASFLIHVY